MTLQSLLQKSQALKVKATAIDVKEYIWCQRGADNEKLELIAVLPTKYTDQALCVFHTNNGNQSGWFTARLYLTKKATKNADLLTGWHYKIEGDNGRVYGIKAELDFYPYESLVNKLVQLGLSIDLISKFGIVKMPSAIN